MVDFRRRPFHENDERNALSGQRRTFATQYSSGYSAVPTQPNQDEADLQDEGFAVSFTKGLPHDAFAQLKNNADYIALVNQINQQDAQNFDTVARGIDEDNPALTRRQAGAADGADIHWRGWESPRSGHYFDLQGPDPDAVSMPPAPELGSEELSAEMAEVYALALLRDVPFTRIADRSGADPLTGIGANQVLDALSAMSWFSVNSEAGLSLQERRRRAARKVDHGPGFPIDTPPDTTSFDTANAFRGSGPGAKVGPYVSQFMLQGNNNSPSNGNIVDASISYGRQVIDQKIESFQPGRDYMLHWNAYVDVQNGADFGSDNSAAIINTRKFIATPRDLAAYVRYDALYQAYLNACLFMLGDNRFSFQQPVINRYSGVSGPGFPDGHAREDGSPPSRQAFATFGGPHILSMVTEVATRCLKAVRRQKFNYHRRARPERIGALLALRAAESDPGNTAVNNVLGSVTASHLDTMLNPASLGPMLDLVHLHNVSRLSTPLGADAHLDFSTQNDATWFSSARNYLLPMAFAEGSPMHPSYGAGHATVAGGCVTMLKAFFNTTDANGDSLPWPSDMPRVVASDDGTELIRLDANATGNMTINGELNKLAANISIGRDMAGVHFYTDYYESMRMGERIATGIIIEQIKQYNEPVEFSFESFDGDHVHILKNDFDYGEPRVYITDSEGMDVELDAWWHRHVQSETMPSVRSFASNSVSNDSRQGSSDTRMHTTAA